MVLCTFSSKWVQNVMFCSFCGILRNSVQSLGHAWQFVTCDCNHWYAKNCIFYICITTVYKSVNLLLISAHTNLKRFVNQSCVLPANCTHAKLFLAEADCSFPSLTVAPTSHSCKKLRLRFFLFRWSTLSQKSSQPSWSTHSLFTR